MKFVPHSNNGDRTFRLFGHQGEEFPIALKSSYAQRIDSTWVLIDENPSLLALLSRHGMLKLAKNEMQSADREIRKMDQATLKYCKQQVALINKYADDSMYRIATRALCDETFAYYDEQGLPTESRRFVLAIALQMGVKLK